MKKVIHYKPGTYLEFTENWIYEQISNLKDYISFIYTNEVKNLQVFPVKKIRTFTNSFSEKKTLNNFIDRSSKKLLGIQPSILYNLIIDKPNIIHAHFGYAGAMYIPYKRIINTPLITTFYGHDIHQLPKENPVWNKRYRALFKHGDLFLVEGNFMKKSLIGIGCPDDKIVVQNLGINVSKIKFQPRVLRPGEEIRILISGRFTEVKGIPDAIEAIGKICNKRKELKIFTTVIGDSNEREDSKEEKRKIFDVVKKYRLEDKINFLGALPHANFIDELYKNHLFLHPSKHAKNGGSEGGAPVSIIEATASGAPVVSTNHCDIPEIVLDKKNGLLAPEFNIIELERVLTEMIERYKDWEYFGAEGRKHIEKNYNSKIQGERLSNIYDNLIN